MGTSDKSRWLALAVVCAGSLMNVLDTTIVGVALPEIRHDLGFSPDSLAWVVNVYLLSYGGFLLLGGRLGDLFGHRRVFATVIAVFTAASLACGLASDQAFLLAARAVQGVGGAVASATALSLVVALFTEPGARAKAMGVFGMASAGGGSVGVLAGGILTGLLSWHWIFLVNVPIGVAVLVAALRVLPAGPARARGQRLDVAGAVLVTAAVMVAVYAVVGAGPAGWTSARTLGTLAGSVVLLAAFACFFLTTLYLQLVLGYSPLLTGLAFLPMNLIMSALSAGAAARLVARLGVKPPLVAGLLLAAAGLALLGRAPVGGHFVTDVLPGGILLGVGAGTALAPLLLAATSSVRPAEAGLASGMANTSFMLGGALGLAVLSGIATSRTGALHAAGAGNLAALAGGYHAAFLGGAACAVLAALLSACWVRLPAAAPAGPGAGEAGQADPATARPTLTSTQG